MASNQTWHLNGRTECQAKSDVQIDAQPKKRINSSYVNLWVHLQGEACWKKNEKKTKNQWLEVWRGIIPSKVIEDCLSIYKNTLDAMSSES